jgi:hypothetical protein
MVPILVDLAMVLGSVTVVGMKKYYDIRYCAFTPG